MDENTKAAAYAATLRAERAEKALREREGQLARLLEMMDVWEENWGGGSIRTDAAVASVRTVIQR